MDIVQTVKGVFNDFREKAGSYVFWASIIGKVLTFTASWIALQLIPKAELGMAIYAFTIVAFLIPFSGMGIAQSLLRYGAKQTNQDSKRAMFSYCLRYGILASVVLAVLLFVFSETITYKLPESASYLKWFALMLLSSFVFEMVKVQYRLEHNNKAFAIADITYSILLVVLMSVGAYFTGALGYTLAFVLSPAIVGLFGLYKIGIFEYDGFKREKGFWLYGVFSSLGNVTTELLIAIDILLIGNILLDNELVTAYKYVTLIPFSLLFLSHVFMSTHFVSLTERVGNRAYIKSFIRNYHLLFAGICIAIGVGSWILGKWLLHFLDPGYEQYFEVFMILIAGVCGVLFMRGLFGNLLSAIGKAQLNFVISLVALGLNIVLNYQLIPSMGIKGAAITSACVMWFTALVSMGVFYYYFKRQRH
jgi:O-antigen/teichoic acid export membrane protein